MLGIIGAMAEEVEQLKAEMKETKVVSLAGMDFIKEKFKTGTWWWCGLVLAK